MKNIIILLSLVLVSCVSVKKDIDNKTQVVNQINYIEMPASDLVETKRFFKEVFGWSFVDYGPEYIGFTDQGVHGGFFQSDLKASTKNGSALIIFYSNELEIKLETIRSAGGTIIKPIFSYPGGRRFHFLDTNGNEFAVWSE